MSNAPSPPKLVLASKSPARAQMLRNAGVAFDIKGAEIDEQALKALLKSPEAETMAMTLAEEKARDVARSRTRALIIGADQMLECDGMRFDKPRTMARARDQLLALRGKGHELVSAACVVGDARVQWRCITKARLVMRNFSEVFLDAYLEAAGDTLLSSVGAYRVEGLGIQLFHSIDGDHHTILGLPLLPLLAFLRDRGVVAA